MNYFNPLSIIENMLATEKDITSLHFSAGKPPQVMANGKLSNVEIKGMVTLSPYQTEVISLALMEGDVVSTQKLVNSGRTSFSYQLPSTRRFQVEVSKPGAFTVVMREAGVDAPCVDEEAEWTPTNEAEDYWQEKRVLLCSGDPEVREKVKTSCQSANLELFVIDSVSQGLTSISSNNINIILLDPKFDPLHSGGIKLMRQLDHLPPRFRRRIFVVLISPEVSTLDRNMAFLNCTNLTINTAQLESSPEFLDQALQDYRELYRAYYQAGGPSSAPIDIDPHSEVTYPVIPIRGTVFFPIGNYRFRIGREFSVAAMHQALADDGRVFIATQHDASIEIPAPDQIHNIGVIARIVNYEALDNGEFAIQVDTIARGKIINIKVRDCWMADIDRSLEYDLFDARIDELKMELKSAISAYLDKLDREGQSDAGKMRRWLEINHPSDISYPIAANLGLSVAERQQFLETRSLSKRLERLIDIIKTRVDH